METENIRWIRALVVCATMTLAATARAAAPEIEAFFGEYEGRAVMDSRGEIQKRDLRVKISPIENGFSVDWTSVTKRANGTLKRKEYSISFHPTRRNNIYRSGERKDLFGNHVPLDPMKGDPYVWARIDNGTLTVYALHVLEDGGYEMQTYARTRIPEGLDLKYTRVRDGEVLRTVTGTLVEVK
ncbi:MAG: hypothetical protein BMS9Abin14_809 [Gammaproteobacteria bacterium]|nr:MAG: hypothetical protein BMS9Abin14_809 [Gammaproteobacteria bacterium]